MKIKRARDVRTAGRSVPKFNRETPTVRREALVDATLLCLKRYGHEGISIRRISAAAGVSIGLINHHFPSKASLVAEAYETLTRSLQDSIRRQVENRALAPRARLSGVFRAAFAPELLDPALFNVWLVFWSMVAHSPEIHAVHERSHGKYRSVLESLLAQLSLSDTAPLFKLRPAGIALSALLDGLWVKMSMRPATFTPREAIALCEDWVSALCNGAFPRLLRNAPGRNAAARKTAGRRKA